MQTTNNNNYNELITNENIIINCTCIQQTGMHFIAPNEIHKNLNEIIE